MNTPPIRILRSGLSGRVWAVTRYTDHGDGRITARVKHDVTDEVNALIAAELREVAGDPALRLSGHSGISITRLRERADHVQGWIA